jgi:hypothetical protein
MLPGRWTTSMTRPDKEFDRRPDPDALLALADQEDHGKLRVFLGAAPGVGKTAAETPERRRARRASKFATCSVWQCDKAAQEIDIGVILD